MGEREEGGGAQFSLSLLGERAAVRAETLVSSGEARAE